MTETRGIQIRINKIRTSNDLFATELGGSRKHQALHIVASGKPHSNDSTINGSFARDKILELYVFSNLVTTESPGQKSVSQLLGQYLLMAGH